VIQHGIYGYIGKENEISIPKIYMHTQVYCDTIHNTKIKDQPKYSSKDTLLKKYCTHSHAHNLSHIEGYNPAICPKIVIIKEHYVK
jgi:hypothetical protein